MFCSQSMKPKIMMSSNAIFIDSMKQGRDFSMGYSDNKQLYSIAANIHWVGDTLGE